MAVLTIEALVSGKSCYNMLPHELVFIYVRGLASLKPGVYTSSLGMEGFRGKGKLHIVVLGPDTDDPVLLQLWKDFTEVDPSKIEDDLIREVMTGLKKDGKEMAEMSEFIQKAFGAEIELVKAEKDAEAARALAAKDAETAKALAAKDAEYEQRMVANASAMLAKGYPVADVMQFTGLSRAEVEALSGDSSI